MLTFGLIILLALLLSSSWPTAEERALKQAARDAHTRHMVPWKGWCAISVFVVLSGIMLLDAGRGRSGMFLALVVTCCTLVVALSFVRGVLRQRRLLKETAPAVHSRPAADGPSSWRRGPDGPHY